MKKFVLVGLLVFLGVFAYAQDATVVYASHVANIGWLDYVSDGETSGTTGQSRQMEALRVAVVGPYSGSIEYRAHVQNVGWMPWMKDNAESGTTGRSLRAEAFEIRLTGQLAQRYDVEYRGHVQNIGWQPWVKNGAMAGTEGQSLRIEAIEIILVEKSSGKRGRPAGSRKR